MFTAWNAQMATKRLKKLQRVVQRLTSTEKENLNKLLRLPVNETIIYTDGVIVVSGTTERYPRYFDV